jgi:hypothetical protein
MKGHDQLIALRRKGLKPTYVWISDYPWAFLDGLTVNVHGDTPELLDLRFLVGTTALVEGPDQSRVDRIANACEAIAQRVIANCNTWDGMRITSTTTTDTEGVMTWPK